MASRRSGFAGAKHPEVVQEIEALSRNSCRLGQVPQVSTVHLAGSGGRVRVHHPDDEQIRFLDLGARGPVQSAYADLGLPEGGIQIVDSRLRRNR